MMSKEKQIEEMAKVIHTADENCGNYFPIVTLLILYEADVWCEGWITDHKATKVMCNFIVAGFMVAAMLLMRARVRTIVYTDLFILSFIDAAYKKGMSLLIAEVMLTYIFLLLFVQWDEQLKEKGGE